MSDVVAKRLVFAIANHFEVILFVGLLIGGYEIVDESLT
jgi:hypothetical protein